MFHNDYDHLRTQEVLSLSPVLIAFDSLMEGKATGIEMWGSYQATPRWRLNAGIMALHQRFTLKPGSNDAATPGSRAQGSRAYSAAALLVRAGPGQGLRPDRAQGGGARQSSSARLHGD
ncbi:hypothetical protein LP420_23425 [Massilia sp. B-10]|nr:hypothetical protein LP420_23425 [Massilia sp. B-10]